jgi:DNA-binding MarR family transcriptional regulator
MQKQGLQYASELLLQLEKFLDLKKLNKSKNENWMLEFSRWIINSAASTGEPSAHSGEGMTDILIGMHLVNIANLLKKEQNRFVAESPFSTFMDFQFLFVLNEHGDMTKSQLISTNNMEMSSGIEVINRLKKFGWIEEKQNPEDKRSKLIFVTHEGRIILGKFRSIGMDIYKSYSVDFDTTEKSAVLKSLELLNALNG